MTSRAGSLKQSAKRVALVLAILAVASSAYAEDWKHLPYLEYQSGQMWLGTDHKTWPGADNVALPAGQQQALDDSRPIWVKGVGYGGTPQPADVHYIWAPACPAGDQSASFTRIFSAPGAPFQGSFSLATAPEDWQFKKRVYRSIEVTLNGVPFARTSEQGSVSGPLTPQQLSAFKFGPNKLAIDVQRRALDKGETCNTQGGKRVGVLLIVQAQFGAEVSADPAAKGLQQTFRLPAGAKGVTLSGALTFRNAGPSVALEGAIVLSGSGPGDLLYNTTQSSQSGVSCALVDPTVVTRPNGEKYFPNPTLKCPYQDLAPGASISVPILASFKPAPGTSPKAIFHVVLTWEINTVWPHNLSTATGSHTATICGAEVPVGYCK